MLGGHHDLGQNGVLGGQHRDQYANRSDDNGEHPELLGGRPREQHANIMGVVQVHNCPDNGEHPALLGGRRLLGQDMREQQIPDLQIPGQELDNAG